MTIVLDKAVGNLPEMSWSDILWAVKLGSEINLEKLADTKNPFEVIDGPRQSSSDLADGEKLFGKLCVSCHGDAGRGGVGGPSLYDRTFVQGRTPWALYRTITLGISGTPMVGRDLSRNDAWRIVSYLESKLSTQESAELDPAFASLRPVAPIDLVDATKDPAEWLTYSGSYDGQRHSTLDQINRSNVGQLRVEWTRQLLDAQGDLETTPIVRGSVMVVTGLSDKVLALDTASGRVLWTYSRDLPNGLKLCCGPVNRGVALLGTQLFLGTVDGHLVALDATTGKVLWDVALVDKTDGYSITGAPLVVDDMVITGVAGGEYAIRGFIDAYDAATGKRRWRFYTVPGPGEPGSETWEPGSLQTGGSPTWLTGSYDPQLHLLYWGVGNPSPNYYGENRKGDNLYSDSVVALDVRSGKLVWYFQFTPHDLHDWDSDQIPVLVDTAIDGSERKLLAWPNRNGFYYLLDRVTGKFLLGKAFAKQTWADGLDADGRPRVRPESIPSRAGATVYPSAAGAINWWSPSYDSRSGLLYVPSIEQGSIYFASPDRPVDSEGMVLGSWGAGIPHEQVVMSVKAIDVVTGQIRWQHNRPRRLGTSIGGTGGLLSTNGGFVFGGDGETLFALDAESGAELWHFDAGGKVIAAPITYQLAGREFISVAAGHSIFTFALPQSIN